jgi:FkbM family methyltransferase
MFADHSSVIQGGGFGVLWKSLRARVKAFLRHPHSQVCYSQEGEDLILQRIFHDIPNGYYVDVGAHHPWRFSNTYLFYRRGWTGINIEPNPSVQPWFAAHRPRDINLQCAISDVDGILTYHLFDEPALNTFDAAVAQGHVETTSYKLVGKRQVAVKRLDKVLSETLPQGQRIDFLSVDVEGLDLAVLRSNDWRRFRPRIVLAEALGSSLDEVANGDVARFMAGEGYRLFAKTYNTLFFVDKSE